MKKQIKCFLAMALAAVMVISAFPQAAQAAEPTKLTVSTQAELNEALKNANLTNLTIASEDSVKIVIRSNILPNLNITINLPLGTVTNSASVKKLTVKNAKKLNEKATGNTIDVKDDKLTIKVTESADVSAINITGSEADIKVANNGQIDGLYVKGSDTTVNVTNNNQINTLAYRGDGDKGKITNNAQIGTLGIKGEDSALNLTNNSDITKMNVRGTDSTVNITNNGNMKNLNVYHDSDIAIGGSSKTQTKVIVKPAAEGASIETATPVKLQAAGAVNVTLKKGAENSSILLTNPDAGVKVTNETKKKIIITDSEGNDKTVKAGKEISVGETEALDKAAAPENPENTQVAENTEGTHEAENPVITPAPVTPVVTPESENPKDTHESGNTEATHEAENPESGNPEGTHEAENPESGNPEGTHEAENPESGNPEGTHEAENPESENPEGTHEAENPESENPEGTHEAENPESENPEGTSESENPKDTPESGNTEGTSESENTENPEQEQPSVPVTPQYTTDVRIVSMSAVSYRQTTYYADGIKEKIELRPMDSDELFSVEEFTYNEKSWISKNTLYSPVEYTITTEYDNNTSRRIFMEQNVPDHPEFSTSITYKYEDDICTSEMKSFDKGDKSVKIQTYTTDESGAVIEIISESTTTYDGDSDKIKSADSWSWYFYNTNSLAVETTKYLPESGNTESVTRIYDSSVTTFDQVSGFLNDSSINNIQMLRTDITRPDGTLVSTRQEDRVSSIDCEYDETGSFPVRLTQQSNHDGTNYVKDCIMRYSGEDTNRVISEGVFKYLVNNNLTEISTYTLVSVNENGNTTYDELSIKYSDDGSSKTAIKEALVEILNGKTPLNAGKENLKIYSTKEYDYYIPKGDYDTIYYRYYRLTKVTELEYDFDNKPYIPSKEISYKYCYDDNTYTLTTSIYNEDGSVKSKESNNKSFEPESNTHLFTEEISFNVN